jgi:O-antigen/teichoic acid export membrane protein
MENSGKSFGRRSIVLATLWTLGGEGGSQALRIVSSLILTRLLVPEYFGIMAVVQVFMQGLNMFSDLGIRPIIIRHERGDDPAFLNTIWTVRLVRGGILALASCAIAWPVSKFYGQPLLAYILPVASLNLLLEGLLSTKIFSHERRLSRAGPTLINLASSVCGIAFMIFWAWKLRSIWALVWGVVVTTLVKVLLSHVALSGERNRLHWDRAAWGEVASFGKWVFLNSIVTFIAMQVDKLVFAKLIRMDLLGVYAIALNIVALPTLAVRAVGAAVAFPAFSRARKESPDMTAIFDRMRLQLLLAGGAALSFLMFNGPWLIGVLYDPRYEAAKWMLQIAALGSWFIVLEASHGFLLLTLGHPRWLTLASVWKILLWIVVVPAALVYFTFPVALAAASAVEAVRYLIEKAKVRKLGVNFRRNELAWSALVLGGGALAVLIQKAPWVSKGGAVQAVACGAAFAAIWGPVGLWYLGKARKTA